jgi:acyl-CoA thioesterase
VGLGLAHRTLSTGVISHTLTFHEPFSAADWLLLSHHSPYAGGGRSYGRADAFRADGQLVASFVQDAMIRRKAEGTGPL